MRTRADSEEFRSSHWRQSLSDILQNFCLKHNIQYKQGMNEVLAPFFFICPPPKSNFLPYALFEAFLFRYLERFFCVDDSSYLYKAFRLFHSLLMFHDPQLAIHLHSNDFLPELYSPQWFLTLYSRSLPLSHVLRLWDVVIAVDDPAFTFFIGLCLLRRVRNDLLLSESDEIPERIKFMKFGGEEDIDNVLSEALKCYFSTPRCFCRLLRLCCVRSMELTPTPGILSSSSTSTATNNSFNLSDKKRKKKRSKQSLMDPTASWMVSTSLSASEIVLSSGDWKEKTNGVGERDDSRGSFQQVVDVDDQLNEDSNENDSSYEQVLAMQSVRQSVMITAQELIDSYYGASTSNPSSTESTEDFSSNSSFWNGSNMAPMSWLLIDLRSSEEVQRSGGGYLPRALKMDPSFLEDTQALDAWIQHFDSMKGCPICIIDMPPTSSPLNLSSSILGSQGASLLKRLLWGQEEKEDGEEEEEIVDQEQPSQAQAQAQQQLEDNQQNQLISTNGHKESRDDVMMTTNNRNSQPEDESITREQRNENNQKEEGRSSSLLSSGKLETGRQSNISQDSSGGRFSFPIVHHLSTQSAPLLSLATSSLNLSSSIRRFTERLPQSLQSWRVLQDEKSRYRVMEDFVIDEDRRRSATKLVQALQAASFPKVCILEGGYPSLIQALWVLKGSVDPLIIEFEAEIWERYLQETGRSSFSLTRTNIHHATFSQWKSGEEMNSCRKYHLGGESDDDDDEDEDGSHGELQRAKRRVTDLSEVEKLRLALKVANQLKHVHMAEMIILKLEQLEYNE